MVCMQDIIFFINVWDYASFLFGNIFSCVWVILLNQSISKCGSSHKDLSLQGFFEKGVNIDGIIHNNSTAISKVTVLFDPGEIKCKRCLEINTPQGYVRTPPCVVVRFLFYLQRQILVV